MRKDKVQDKGASASPTACSPSVEPADAGSMASPLRPTGAKAWHYHNSDQPPPGIEDPVDAVGTDGLMVEGYWPYNVVWKNVVRWRLSASEDHTPNTLDDSLLAVLSELYAKEINCGIQSFWDGGFEAWIGDDMNGRRAVETFHPDRRFGRPLHELPGWLLSKALGHPSGDS